MKNIYTPFFKAILVSLFASILFTACSQQKKMTSTALTPSSQLAIINQNSIQLPLVITGAPVISTESVEPEKENVKTLAKLQRSFVSKSKTITATKLAAHKSVKNSLEKAFKVKSNSVKYKAHNSLDYNLKMAIIFLILGLLLGAFTGYSNIFGILALIFFIIGIVFLLLWVLNQ
ncbi:MAG: hypothetical protein SGJ04_07145 [Bacteroidota bacterium]|nr:hypothetical protein [Bacteroidota bacterium]